MKAVYALRPSPRDPLDGLRYGERPEPVAGDGWTIVSVEAAAVNHHDLWTLRGAGLPADRYPMILGCECSGRDEQGREVIVNGMVCAPEWRHEPMRDPDHTALSESVPGTFGERVAVPAHATFPKPPEFTHAQASCLTATWLTGYRMLFTKAELRPGATVLVQGCSGGLSSALIALARAAGLRVWVTTRNAANAHFALAVGAERVLAPGQPPPERVDAVMESVGSATWSHSLRAAKPGGTIVVAGATTGADPPAHLGRIFWQELRVLGSSSGTPAELGRLLQFMREHDLRPRIAAELPFSQAALGLQRMIDGDLGGKIVLRWR